jgi:hypothetical protein
MANEQITPALIIASVIIIISVYLVLYQQKPGVKSGTGKTEYEIK